MKNKPVWITAPYEAFLMTDNREMVKRWAKKESEILGKKIHFKNLKNGMWRIFEKP